MVHKEQERRGARVRKFESENLLEAPFSRQFPRPTGQHRNASSFFVDFLCRPLFRLRVHAVRVFAADSVVDVDVDVGHTLVLNRSILLRL